MSSWRDWIFLLNVTIIKIINTNGLTGNPCARKDAKRITKEINKAMLDVFFVLKILIENLQKIASKFDAWIKKKILVKNWLLIFFYYVALYSIYFSFFLLYSFVKKDKQNTHLNTHCLALKFLVSIFYPL